MTSLYEAIKSLELETKKTLIRQSADIEIVNLDLKSAMHAYPVNVEAAQKLVDQKYELQKTEDKTLVEAIAKLKGQLSKDQDTKLHALFKQGEKGEHGYGSKESR